MLRHPRFIDSDKLGLYITVERLTQLPPVDALTRVDIRSYARLIVKEGYGLLWRSQRKVQNLQVDLNVLLPNAQIGPKTNDAQSLGDLSELMANRHSPFACS